MPIRSVAWGRRLATSRSDLAAIACTTRLPSGVLVLAQTECLLKLTL